LARRLAPTFACRDLHRLHLSALLGRMSQMSQAQLAAMNQGLTTTAPPMGTTSTSSVMRHVSGPQGTQTSRIPVATAMTPRAGTPSYTPAIRPQMSGASLRMSQQTQLGQGQQAVLSRRSLPSSQSQVLAYTPAPSAPPSGYPSYTPLPGGTGYPSYTPVPSGTCFTPLAPGPARRPSYTPLPVAPKQGIPSYTPLPVASQQGVPSYTPLPTNTRQGAPNNSGSLTLNQTQQATPRYSPPAAEQAASRATAEDNTVAFMPYFAIRDAENFFDVCNRCIELVKTEELCLGYGFSVSAGPQQNMAFCREAFLNAEGVIAHLHNIEVLFKEGLCKYGELVSLQIHGPKRELDKLREDPIIQELGPEFYELMPGSFEVVELPMQQLAEVQTAVETSTQPSRCTPVLPIRQQARVLGGGLGEISFIGCGEIIRQVTPGPFGR